MWDTLSSVRDLGRIQEIAVVLLRYGFGDVAARVGMTGALEKAGRLLRMEHADQYLTMPTPERLRRTLQDLGPTFIKFGQILSTRVDLLPPEYLRELGQLQNNVPALDFELLRPQVRQDLGCEPEDIFARIDTVPLAAASLAQTHRAWLADGTALVLKIRRPGIREVVEADLRLLARLADIAEARAPDLRRYHPVEVVRQFTASLRNELDFAAECRNAERIAANFAGHPEIVVPAVVWPLTSERLNVQEFVGAIPGADIAAVEAAGLDRAQLARSGANIVLKMVLEDGLFHADPHPGNIFYLPDGRIAVIDFGMVGHVNAQRRGQVARLLYGLVAQRPEDVADILIDWAGQAEVDEARLQADIDEMIDQYRGLALKDLHMGRMLLGVSALLRQHALVLPGDLALMIKAFLTLEGLGRLLDPDFDMASEARPFLERAMLQRYSPRRLAKRGQRALAGSLDLLEDLPRELRRMLRRYGQGKFKLEVTSLRPFGNQVAHAVNRLTMGIITAALIVGSSIVIDSGGVASRFRTVLGLGGFIGAGLCGVVLLVWILRSGRR
ncbi:ABC1 kinase family protein [Pseudoxanthomonas spadix]|uniref:ABC1 kinase family protein n=1 Tax=Pseudoxanthomonas spadix TaxID=415229 RepID=UPI0005B7DC75|nr:AarF/UbiB family protein [Pseudoxanthomonas spadix]MBP3974205.1 ubiquinone biosynthesis protein UbiB [Pseudoxanthomonas spadix]RMW96667.1 ubiquinone biosynthesis protein UbiB [Pseudoxanthomonas spadix]